MSATSFNVAVIGGGTAGLAAAAEAARHGADVVLFEASPLFGGLVANVGRLDDWPSASPVAGAMLADMLASAARATGVDVVNAPVSALRIAGSSFVVVAADRTYACSTVILATGAALRRLGVPGEVELTGRGVSQCDWCDGGLYRGRDVAVVGGGNAALQAALHLSDICKTVTLVVRGDRPRARRDYVLQVADKSNVEFLWETRVERMLGTSALEQLELVDDAAGTTMQRAFDGVFVFAGLVPELDFVECPFERDEAGYARVDRDTATSAPGLYAVGAARSSHGDSVMAAIADGSNAARAAVARLRELDIL